MNKEEYKKASTYEKIDYDIQMELYFKYNDTIATMNDYLGEMYGYSDVKEVEDAEKEEELSLYRKALKEKCDAIDKAIKYLNKLGTQDGTLIDYKIDKFIKEDLLEILKGDDNE